MAVVPVVMPEGEDLQDEGAEGVGRGVGEGTAGCQPEATAPPPATRRRHRRGGNRPRPRPQGVPLHDDQNLAICPGMWNAIQKLSPSLHTPRAASPPPSGNFRVGSESAAFQSESDVHGVEIRIRWPSNRRVERRLVKPLPVRLARRAPVEARTTEIVGVHRDGDPDVRAVEDGKLRLAAKGHGLEDRARGVELQKRARPNFGHPDVARRRRAIPWAVIEAGPRRSSRPRGSSLRGSRSRRNRRFIGRPDPANRRRRRRRWATQVLATVVTNPAGCEGSIRSRLNRDWQTRHEDLPHRHDQLLGAPAATFQFRGTCHRWLAHRETVPKEPSETQTSAPSDRRVVRSRTQPVVRPRIGSAPWVVQDWLIAARWLPRFRTPSTVLDEKRRHLQARDVGCRIVRRRRGPGRDPEGRRSPGRRGRTRQRRRR